MDNDSIITLQDEQGNDVQFEFLDIITYENEQYAIFFPVDDPEADEVVILKIEGSEDDPEMDSYVSVDDDTVLEAVYNLFREQNSDIFEFIDD